jgi:hypothetical protein
MANLFNGNFIAENGQQKHLALKACKLAHYRMVPATTASIVKHVMFTIIIGLKLLKGTNEGQHLIINVVCNISNSLK